MHIHIKENACYTTKLAISYCECHDHQGITLHCSDYSFNEELEMAHNDSTKRLTKVHKIHMYRNSGY